MARILSVFPYDNQWKIKFKKERELLLNIFQNNAISIHHIGSTSIEGMSAKPIIDILIEVKSLDEVDAQNTLMLQIGYDPRGENGVPNRRYFQKGGDQRTHHVHCFAVGNPEIERHLIFRDYLNTHPKMATKYSMLKEWLAKKYEDDIPSYIKGKAPLIHEIDQKAAIWMKEKRKS